MAAFDHRGTAGTPISFGSTRTHRSGYVVISISETTTGTTATRVSWPNYLDGLTRVFIVERAVAQPPLPPLQLPDLEPLLYIPARRHVDRTAPPWVVSSRPGDPPPRASAPASKPALVRRGCRGR